MSELGCVFAILSIPAFYLLSSLYTQSKVIAFFIKNCLSSFLLGAGKNFCSKFSFVDCQVGRESVSSFQRTHIQMSRCFGGVCLCGSLCRILTKSFLFLFPAFNNNFLGTSRSFNVSPSLTVFWSFIICGVANRVNARVYGNFLYY